MMTNDVRIIVHSVHLRTASLSYDCAQYFYILTTKYNASDI